MPSLACDIQRYFLLCSLFHAYLTPERLKSTLKCTCAETKRISGMADRAVQDKEERQNENDCGFCLAGGWLSACLWVFVVQGQTADRKSPPVAGTKADKDNIAREEDDQADEELKKEDQPKVKKP